MVNAAGGRIHGRIDTSDPERLVFVADEQTLGDIPLRIEYSAIHHLEFGQKVRRRVTAATAQPSPGAAWTVGAPSEAPGALSHCRVPDDLGVNQVAVLALGKSVVRDTLTVIEARSGRPSSIRTRRPGGGGGYLANRSPLEFVDAPVPGRALRFASPRPRVPRGSDRARISAPLPIPRVFQPVRSDSTTDYYEIVQQ